MFIGLILYIFANWCFLCAIADRNCTEGCTIKPHLQCEVLVHYECPMPFFDIKPPGPPVDLHVTTTYVFDQSVRALVCVADLNITWRVPQDASRLFVKAFQLQVLSLSQPALKYCVYYNLTRANWTDNDDEIQYCFQCLTLPPGNYAVLIDSLPFSLYHTKMIQQRINVDKVYPRHDGSCELPPPRTPPTTTTASSTSIPRVPVTHPQHSVVVMLAVAGGGVVIVVIVILAALLLWKCVNRSDVFDDTDPIWNNRMPAPGRNNECIDDDDILGHPIIPPFTDEVSRSSAFFEQVVKNVNQTDNCNADMVLPSENVCGMFDDSIYNDHSSELCCQNCGMSIKEGVSTGSTNPGLACKCAFDHSSRPVVENADMTRLVPVPVMGCGDGGLRVGPRVRYEGGVRPNPVMGYNDGQAPGEGYFGGAEFDPRGRYDDARFGKRGVYRHGPSNLENDNEYEGSGEV